MDMALSVLIATVLASGAVEEKLNSETGIAEEENSATQSEEETKFNRDFFFNNSHEKIVHEQSADSSPKSDFLSGSSKTPTTGIWAGFILLIGGAGCAFYLNKRVRTDNSGRMRILESINIGPKRALHLVEHSGNIFMIGCSESGMNLLNTIKTGAEEDKQEWSNEETMSSFSQEAEKLRKKMSEALA